MTGLVAALLLLGATTVFAAMSPNYATNSHEDMSISALRNKPIAKIV